MRLLQSLLILLALTSTSLAQITVRQLSVVEIPENTEKIGQFAVVPKDFKSKPFNIVHAKWETKVPQDRVRVKLTDSGRKNVPFVDLKDGGIVVTQVGHFWLEVRGTHFDKTTQDFYEIDESVDFVVDGIGPGPEPGPDPEPEPEPTPNVDKIDNLSVLMVYESGRLSAYSEAQRGILNSTALRGWMDKNVPKDNQGLANWRVLDKDTRFPASSDIVYKKWLQVSPPELPYLIIGNKDVIVYKGELPTDIEQIKAIITKYKK